MAYYRRPYFRRYSRGRRFFRRNFWYRRNSRYASRRRGYANGTSRSTTRVKIPITYSTTLQIQRAADGTYTFPAPIGVAVPFGASTTTTIPVMSANASPLYRNYAQLYDEVKCGGMVVKIACTSQIGGSGLPSLQIFTGIDRKYHFSEGTPSFDQLKVYSTFGSVLALNNSVARFTRTCFASDLFEKAEYHDCSLDTYGKDSYLSRTPPPKVPFCPALFMTCSSPVSETTTVSFTFDITYYFTFRNPKYGGAAPSTSAMSAPARRAEDLDGLSALASAAEAAEFTELPDDEIEEVPDADAPPLSLTRATSTLPQPATKRVHFAEPVASEAEPPPTQPKN